jgi:tetratricopeptide (TPR) repeat protein
VAAEKVRPFWGRAGALFGGGAVAIVLVAGLAIFTTMRIVGFPVTTRQIFWPPAWSELREVRARFFMDQARDYYAQGQYREAAHALTVAHEMNPEDYDMGISLAQFYQASRPDLVDLFYTQLLSTHPERRAETARAWFRSLLARGRLAEIAKLARQQIKLEPGEVAVWTHALVFSARCLRQPKLLDDLAEDPRVPASARAVITLEAQLRRNTPSRARQRLLDEPLPADFTYARIHRIERLIEFGDTKRALALLEESRNRLGGRDVMRLILAAHAVEGNQVVLAGETALLLESRDPAVGLGLVAQHLINHPDNETLKRCIAALAALPPGQVSGYNEAVTAVYCAAALAGEWPQLAGIRGRFRLEHKVEEAVWIKGEKLLARNGPAPEPVLLLIRPMPLELNYALLERMSRREKQGQ